MLVDTLRMHHNTSVVRRAKFGIKQGEVEWSTEGSSLSPVIKLSHHIKVAGGADDQPRHHGGFNFP